MNTIIIIVVQSSSKLFATQLTPLHLAAWLKSFAIVVTTLIQGGGNGNVDALDGDQQSQEFKAVTK